VIDSGTHVRLLWPALTSVFLVHDGAWKWLRGAAAAGVCMEDDRTQQRGSGNRRRPTLSDWEGAPPSSCHDFFQSRPHRGLICDEVGIAQDMISCRVSRWTLLGFAMG